MKTHRKSKRGFTLVELLVVIVIIAALAGLAAPQILKMRSRADVTEAISNGKQLALALTMFQADYGSFPDDGTAERIASISDFDEGALTGTESNAYYRQLIASGVTDSEMPFYMKSIISPRKPDNNIIPINALEAGEVGFGYFMRNGGLAIPQRGALPLAAGPFDDTGNFDPEQFSRKAIAVFVDNSALELDINTEGDPVLASGNDLDDSSTTGNIWGSITPDLITPATAGGTP